MTVRQPITDILATGQLPDLHNSTYDEIQRAEDLLNQMEKEKPVTGEKAAALVTVFGPDDCFGLAWTLLHIMETAPGVGADEYLAHSDNYWVHMLRNRREFAQSSHSRAYSRHQGVLAYFAFAHCCDLKPSVGTNSYSL